MYGDKGDYAKALEYYNKCLEIKTKILGEDSAEVLQLIKKI